VVSVLATAALLSGAACGNDKGAAKSTGATVAASEKEFAISLTPNSSPSGRISFKIANQGTVEHEFVIFRTDLAPEKLPTKSDGTVDEEGNGVEHVTEKGHVPVGTSPTLNVTLKAGSYVMICNLPGHYAGGMHTGFTVT
jgi:uncharacterized cupredoxin-like copper-binding protein